MSLRPVQQPHPPIWMGISSVESAVFAAKAGYNIVALMPAAAMKSRVAAYRDAQTSDACKLGISYLIVVAEDDATAMRDASRAYTRWHTSFHHLYTLHGRAPMLGAWPSEFSGLMDQQRAIAGSPQPVADFLCEQVETSGINYVVSQLMFGDLPHESAVRSIRAVCRGSHAAREARRNEANHNQEATMSAVELALIDLVIANRVLARIGAVDAYGHVSVRHPTNKDHFLLSRSRSPELVEQGDIMEFDLKGNVIGKDNRPPYLERFIHAAVYAAVPTSARSCTAMPGC